jgi:hypothetical protein
MKTESQIIRTIESTERAILNYFLNGGKLTVLEALRTYHTTELRKIVCRIIDKGYPIKKVWEKHEGKRYVRYSLDMVAMLDRKIAEAKKEAEALEKYYSEPTIV